jgi:NAD(P)-dependent dehydrogenase (short-subunit alcohol dehydrogenase family)
MARYSLNGKVALVTGAARGIGLETARAILARGGSVVVNDLDPGATERAAAELGDRALAAPGDVTDKQAMTDAVQLAVDRFGGLDVVVANAGTGPAPTTMRGMDPEVFERVLEIDLQGVWRTVQPALEQIVARRGQVVVISSVYAFANGVMASPYAIAKAGVEAMGRALRVELAPHGAGATVGHFGFVDTVMVREAFDDDPQGSTLLDSLPEFITRRLTPAQAAEALIVGIEKRSPRVIAPSGWRVPYFARGLFGPLMDFVLARDKRVAEQINEVESPGAVRGNPTTPAS